MKTLSLLFVSTIFSVSYLHSGDTYDITDQFGIPDTLFLNVVYPDADTVEVIGTRYRIAASTLHTARAYINDREVKVYSSGAFVGLVNVERGENPLRLLVISVAGDSLWKDFVLKRPHPITTSPRDPLVIDDIMMEPAQYMWFMTGDILEVRFKGSPGYEATFEIEGVASGIPMIELPAEEAGGLGGVYIGRYIFKEEDEAYDARVRFQLRKSFWSRERAYAPGRVTHITGELPRVVRVIGERPFLNVGLGTDRLGGAKLGYVDNGVLVEITGRVGRQYRVRLSDQMTGWLPLQFAELLPLETPLPRSLTGSILATGGRNADVVTISLNEKLPYVSKQVVDPYRIVVDIFGATSNTNWITHHRSAQGIKNVSWNQVAEDHFRLLIDLAHDHHWGYSVEYDANANLRIRIKRPPVIADPDSVLKGLVFVVDAGHGGENNGALGATGAKEKGITLAISKYLESELLAKGARVIMTRTGDYDLSMLERVNKALSANAHFLVSIHCNSIGLSSNPELVRGTSTYYRHLGFHSLARIIYDKLLELDLAEFGVVGSFNFTLNALTELPNVLVETAFISNPEDEIKLLNNKFQQEIVRKIVEGFEGYVKRFALLSSNVDFLLN